MIEDGAGFIGGLLERLRGAAEGGEKKPPAKTKKSDGAAPVQPRERADPRISSEQAIIINFQKSAGSDKRNSQGVT